MKDLIKYKYNKIAPMEIENLLQKHESVHECLVFGKKDPQVRELVSAVVVRNPNTNVSNIY